MMTPFTTRSLSSLCLSASSSSFPVSVSIPHRYREMLEEEGIYTVGDLIEKVRRYDDDDGVGGPGPASSPADIRRGGRGYLESFLGFSRTHSEDIAKEVMSMETEGAGRMTTRVKSGEMLFMTSDDALDDTSDAAASRRGSDEFVMNTLDGEEE